MLLWNAVSIIVVVKPSLTWSIPFGSLVELLYVQVILGEGEPSDVQWNSVITEPSGNDILLLVMFIILAEGGSRILYVCRERVIEMHVCVC